MTKKICFCAIFALAACSAYAFDIQGTTFEASLGGGIDLSGKFEASWYSDFADKYTVSETTEPSWLFRGTFDCYVAKNLAVGLLLVHASITPKEDIYYDDGETTTLIHIGMNDISILDYCLGIVGRIPLSRIISIRTGLYAGGRSSFSTVPEAREFGLAIDGSLGLNVLCFGGVFAFAEVGFLYQPYGGVVDIAYIRGGPIVYCAIGLGL